MKKLALIFPGQGSQYVGMGKALCDKYEVARQTFEEANEAVGFDLQKLCFEGSIEELTKTENTQPAILTASVAAFRVYMQETGVAPVYSAGHSLGEFSALTCAGAIAFADAVKIVKQRGKFMQEAVPIGLGGMSAIAGIDKSVIEAACLEASSIDEIVVVSNYNSPEQIVISGHQGAVNKAGEILKGKGARVIPLKVSAPFHSPLMQPAADKLEQEMKKYTYNQFKWPVISNVTALPYAEPEKIITNLTEQMVKGVQWQASMEYMANNGVGAAIELGPQVVLKNLMKKNAPSIVTYSYDKAEDVKAIEQAFEKKAESSDTTKLDTLAVITRSMAIAVCTRNRNWDNDEYQSGVVEPYRKIQQMADELEREGKEPTMEQMKEALAMLKSVFTTKKTPVEEQIERFNQLFGETGTRELFADFKMPTE
ncbi:MAG: ACP S-malonyltransferase [Clostridia bacterium]|nr:ACP S-malonyltransferase [Clostridia bacterium]